MTELTEKQILTIEALCTSSSIREAAEKAGVNPCSVSRWKRSPEFRTAYASARREVLAETTAKLAAVGATVVDTLAAIVLDGNAALPARVAAGRTLLNLSYRCAEQEDVAARIDRLEAQLAGLPEEE